MYLDRRRSLSKSAVDQLSEQISEQFFSVIHLVDIHMLHVFLPIEQNNEPDTWKIIHRLRLEHPGIKIVVPKVLPKGALSHHELDYGPLRTSGWGIPEPSEGNEVLPGQIDLVIVPLVVADKQGHRVGYGKGYYDRFLSECRADCIKVGLSLFPLVNTIPGVEVHDHRLNLVITPEAVIACS